MRQMPSKLMIRPTIMNMGLRRAATTASHTLLALAVDMAFQFSVAQLGLDIFGLIGRIRPHSGSGVAPHQ